MSAKIDNAFLKEIFPPERTDQFFEGLSTVFRKHPVIDAAGTAAKVAEKMGWDNFEWSIGATQEESSALHWIPFQVKKK